MSLWRNLTSLSSINTQAVSNWRLIAEKSIEKIPLCSSLQYCLISSFSRISHLSALAHGQRPLAGGAPGLPGSDTCHQNAPELGMTHEKDWNNKIWDSCLLRQKRHSLLCGSPARQNRRPYPKPERCICTWASPYESLLHSLSPFVFPPPSVSLSEAGLLTYYGCTVRIWALKLIGSAPSTKGILTLWNPRGRAVLVGTGSTEKHSLTEYLSTSDQTYESLRWWL